MMKTKYLIFLLILGIALNACKQENEELLTFTYKIDKVVCQANSNYFVADGVSQLGLEVKLYTIAGYYKDINGKDQPIYKEIPKERWQSHTIKFFDKSGKEYPSTFTTTEANVPYIDFYAEVDGIRSSKPILQLLAESPETGEAIPVEPEPIFFRMNVKAAIPVGAVKRIPVVFHVIDFATAKDRMQELDASAIYYVVDLYNKVFGRKNSVASNGANPNIEFVPALRDPSGKILKEPGINRVYLTDDQNKSQFGTAFVFGRTDMYWDYDRYLNIWITTNSSYTATSEANRYARSIPFVFDQGEYDAAQFPLPASVTLKVLANATEKSAWKTKPTNLENVGLVFHKNTDAFAKLYPAYVSQMSAFLGVIPNSAVTETSLHYGNPKRWVDDFCDDTFSYCAYYADPAKGGLDKTDFGNSRTKYTVTVDPNGTTAKAGYPWIIYTSENTGEQSSFQSVITQDQAKRIDWALNHAIGRQMWKNSYAINPIP